MVKLVEQFFRSNPVQDENDIDSLLELASFLRQLIAEEQYPAINQVIRYTIEQGCGEAFSWCMAILQEELEKEDSPLAGFDCALGKSIPHYDDLVELLQVDFNDCRNDLEKIYDSYGEVEAFFNILVYGTGYDNIHFVSAENFDTRDNDFVQYKLLFTKIVK